VRFLDGLLDGIGKLAGSFAKFAGGTAQLVGDIAQSTTCRQYKEQKTHATPNDVPHGFTLPGLLPQEIEER
jgi:hypothetical protein